MTNFGVLSIAPPLLAIALAIVTRKAILSLFLGIWSGAVIYTGGLGIVQTFDWIVAAIVADDGFQATILVFTLLLGSGVAMVWNLGGTYAIRDWAIERLDTQRKAGLAAWVLGVILFFRRLRQHRYRRLGDEGRLRPAPDLPREALVHR